MLKPKSLDIYTRGSCRAFWGILEFVFEESIVRIRVGIELCRVLVVSCYVRVNLLVNSKRNSTCLIV